VGEERQHQEHGSQEAVAKPIRSFIGCRPTGEGNGQEQKSHVEDPVPYLYTKNQRTSPFSPARLGGFSRSIEFEQSVDDVFPQAFPCHLRRKRLGRYREKWWKLDHLEEIAEER